VTGGIASLAVQFICTRSSLLQAFFVINKVCFILKVAQTEQYSELIWQGEELKLSLIAMATQIVRPTFVLDDVKDVVEHEIVRGEMHNVRDRGDEQKKTCDAQRERRFRPASALKMRM